MSNYTDKRSSLKKRSKASNNRPTDKMFDEISHQTSQYNSEYYDRLKKEGRLHRFLEIVARCALEGRTMASTVDELNEAFCDYFKKGGLTVDTFKKMVNRYPDIFRAWSTRTGTANVNASLLKDALMNMFIQGKLNYDQIFDLMKYFDQGIFKSQNSADYIPTKKSISETKTIKEDVPVQQGYSSETISTINSIKQMINNIDLEGGPND